MDPLAKDFEHLTPYNYGLNNPVLMIDPDGMASDSTNKSTSTPSPKSNVSSSGFIFPLVNLPEVIISGGSGGAAAEAGPYVAGLYGAWRLGQWGGEHPREYEQGFMSGIQSLNRGILFTNVVNIFINRLINGSILQTKSKDTEKDQKDALPEGFKETKEFGKPHGQKVYKKGNKYYSKDVDGHNGGAWKVFEKQGTKLKRVGTADEKLNIFKK